jgi:hypothetical protein
MTLTPCWRQFDDTDSRVLEATSHSLIDVGLRGHTVFDVFKDVSYADFSRLGHDAMCFGIRVPKFRKILLPPSSE